jgi:hypothetical protein
LDGEALRKYQGVDMKTIEYAQQVVDDVEKLVFKKNGFTYKMAINIIKTAELRKLNDSLESVWDMLDQIHGKGTGVDE